ncbi:uncharacterized protein LOC130823323 [Amaranthus tricolor]|uniref:uncharacterized protein LOC130823323 n=1 Tax=Amaranthus tricolor TaxID=29722 RepID=UPI00258FBAF8|nr:uncharacterized protein LOC130823323 [Amaranthus tricolor]
MGKRNHSKCEPNNIKGNELSSDGLLRWVDGSNEFHFEKDELLDLGESEIVDEDCEIDSAISPNFVPDYNHELFLGHGDNTNHSLSTKHLNGLNFEQWERLVQISLVAKNKMGFVDGSCKKPADPHMAKQWERCNKMVISWLLHSCEENISSSVLYYNSAADIWKELKNRFSQSNGPKILQIDKELNSFEQGNLSIAEYFTKLKSLWDAYDSLVKIPKCSCGLCTYDVNGLNGAYKTVRGNILMIKPVPDVNTAYSILIQDETQREFSDNSVSEFFFPT